MHEWAARYFFFTVDPLALYWVLICWIFDASDHVTCWLDVRVLISTVYPLPFWWIRCLFGSEWPLHSKCTEHFFFSSEWPLHSELSFASVMASTFFIQKWIPYLFCGSHFEWFWSFRHYGVFAKRPSEEHSQDHLKSILRTIWRAFSKPSELHSQDHLKSILRTIWIAFSGWDCASSSWLGGHPWQYSIWWRWISDWHH